LKICEHEEGRVLPKRATIRVKESELVSWQKLTFTGAFTSRVMTKTTVPPSVHQTLKVLMRPTAFVPTVLIMPENMFTAHAIPVISNLVKVLPWPISAMDARYRATLYICQIAGSNDANATCLKFPELPVNTMAME